LFAHEHALTSAEALVLGALCQGRAPRDIAVERETRLSTVRTQIASIKSKTGACSIRELLSRVAMLPPLIPVFA
jgi:DNA-binding NarL/FixJ family response regulator